MWDKLLLESFGVRVHIYRKRGRSGRVFKLVTEGIRTGRRRI